MLNYLLFLAVIFLIIRLAILLNNKSKLTNSTESDGSKSDEVLDDVKKILNSEED